MLAPLAFALAYWAAAAVSLALTRGADGIATMWPASGVLLAGLLWLPARLGRPCLAMAAAASLAFNLSAGNGVGLSLVFTGANMIEALVAVYVIGRTGDRRLSFIDPRDVARFCLAAVIASACSAGVAWLGSGIGDGLFAVSWLTTVTLGMLIVTPAMLIALEFGCTGGSRPALSRSTIEGAALLAMVAAVSVATFSQSLPVLFLPLVTLLAATYRLGPLGAAVGVLIIALIGPPLTGMGYGPIAQTASGTRAVFFLQFYLLASFATALPLAALLAAQRRLSAQCAASERMHRLLADSSTDIIVRLTPDGLPLYVSPAIHTVLGYPPEAVMDRPLRDIIHPADRDHIAGVWARMLAGTEGERFIFRQRRHDGENAWLEAACRLIDAEDGGHEVVGAIRDVTTRHLAETSADEAGRRMQEANRLLGMAERVAQVGHWRLDLGDYAMFWSPEVFRIHGLVDEAMSLPTALAGFHADDRDRVTGVVGGSVETARPFDVEARIVRPDGEIRHVILRGQPEFGADGEAVALFGVLQDVTRQVLAERELDAALRAAEEAAARAIRMADTDALTGVASRRKSLAVLDEAIATAHACGEPLALGIFDIDHFKAVNDRWGHAAGDAVLRRVARAACQAVRPTDLVGRLGGEEFVVILPGMAASHAVTLAETLRRAIEASADGIEAGPAVTASIGVALLVPGGTAAALLGEADRALYRAKAAGRNLARLAA